MRSLRLKPYGAGLFIIVTLVTGCSQAQLPAGQSAALPRTFGGRSLATPGVKVQNLVYVSDIQTSSVYVYAWGGRLVNTLTGFVQPYGLCSDVAGNVYVTDNLRPIVIEYTHRGSRIGKITDPGQLPSSCAVDPKTGNLAVSNFSGRHGAGGVSIYANAKGKATVYVFPEFEYGYFCGYDNKGDLFVDAKGSRDSNFALFELPAGGNAFTKISLNQTLTAPGGVQWDGHHVAVGDSGTNVIYQVDVTGSAGNVVGSTPLGGASTVWEFWIGGGTVIGANAASTHGNVLVWNYPAGGNIIRSFANNIGAPFGLTVSVPGK